MGASGWDYRVRYADSVETTLGRLQEQLLDSSDYMWPWDGSEDEPAPAMYADYFELNAAKEVGEFWDEGTHTILTWTASPGATRGSAPFVH